MKGDNLERSHDFPGIIWMEEEQNVQNKRESSGKFGNLVKSFSWMNFVVLGLK